MRAQRHVNIRWNVLSFFFAFKISKKKSFHLKASSLRMNYSHYLHITRTPNVGIRNSGQINYRVIYTGFWGCVAAKFNVDLAWFSSVLWHINHCRFFKAKSFLYILNLGLIFLNEPGLIFFTQLNGFTYFYQIRIPSKMKQQFYF